MNISLTQLETLEANQWPNDPFFGTARKLLFRGVKEVAAISQYPDLLLCYVLLKSRNLAGRVEASDLDAPIKGLILRSQCSSFSALTKNAILADAAHELRKLLLKRLDSEELELRRAEVERLLPSDEPSDSAESEASNESRNRKVAQFDSAEAAERAAWMLRGECINVAQVIVPWRNANSYALDAIAAIVGSRWSWVKAPQ